MKVSTTQVIRHPETREGIRVGVTQFDISEFIGDAFRDGTKEPKELADLAAERGARPAVVSALRRLDLRPYRDLHDVFDAMPDVPRDSDPWTAAGAGGPAVR